MPPALGGCIRTGLIASGSASAGYTRQRSNKLQLDAFLRNSLAEYHSFTQSGKMPPHYLLPLVNKR